MAQQQQNEAEGKNQEGEEEKPQQEEQTQEEQVEIPLIGDLSSHQMKDLSFLGGFLKKLQQSHDLLCIYYSSWKEKEPGKTTRSLRIFYFFLVLLISLSVSSFLSAFYITQCDVDICHRGCVSDFGEDVCRISPNGTFHFPYSRNSIFCEDFPGCSFEDANCTRRCNLICDTQVRATCPIEPLKHIFYALVIAPFITIIKTLVKMILAHLFVALSCKGYCVLLRKIIGIFFIALIILIFIIIMLFTSDFLLAVLPSFGYSLLLSLFVTDPIVIFGIYLVLEKKCLGWCCCCRPNKTQKTRGYPTPTYKYVYITVPPQVVQ